MKLTEVPARGKNVKWRNFQQTRTPYNLTLGRTYVLGNRTKKAKQIRAAFIQTSPKGFNFLDLSTNKCVFKQPLYRSGFKPYEQENVFFIISSIVLYAETEEPQQEKPGALLPLYGVRNKDLPELRSYANFRKWSDGFLPLLQKATQYSAADKKLRSDIIRRHAIVSPIVRKC